MKNKEQNITENKINSTSTFVGVDALVSMQPSLFSFDDANDWRAEWKDMPEFIQEDLTSSIKVIVHFRNEYDFREFEALIGQRLKKNGMTISCWYPEAEKRRYAHLRYEDES